MIEVNRIHLMDAFEGMRQLPDKSVDLIVTDPPYGIASKNKLTIMDGELKTTADAWGQWDTFAHPMEYDILMMRLICEAYRVLKPGGAFYCFTARETNARFLRMAVDRGFTYRNVFALVKKNVLPAFFKNCWRSAFDLCFFVSKGKIKHFNFLEQREMKNLYEYPSKFKHSKHPTEKPLELIERFIRVSSTPAPGSLILDPFAGSGTTLVAAKKHGRQFIGFERDASYVKMANVRLKDCIAESDQKDKHSGETNK